MYFAARAPPVETLRAKARPVWLVRLLGAAVPRPACFGGRALLTAADVFAVALRPLVVLRFASFFARAISPPSLPVPSLRAAPERVFPTTSVRDLHGSRSPRPWKTRGFS